MNKIILGECLSEMRKMDDNSISAIVTDPPYFLTNDNGSGFMGKSWDSIHELSRYAWENKEFVSFAINFFLLLKAESSMEEENIAQMNANLNSLNNQNNPLENVNCVQENLQLQNVLKRDFAHLLVLTKLDLVDLLKELSPYHIELIENSLNGEKNNALFVIPISLLIKELKHAAQKNVIISPKVECLEGKEILLTSTDLQRIKSVIEVMIGTKLEKTFTKETIGVVNFASLNARENKFNVITSSHIKKAELTKWLTSSLCAINAIRERKSIPNYLIENFLCVIFKEALRVSKPGTWLLAFGGTRTHHRLTCAIEDAGWEIRDCIMYMYGSGFPKSKGCLKPAYEPIVLARKKSDKISDNFLNIDECRIEGKPRETHIDGNHTGNNKIYGKIGEGYQGKGAEGRWPANVIFDEEAGEELGDKSRYFYCPKASSKERNAGLEGMPLKECGMMEDDNYPIKTGSGNLRDTKRQNFHPTVKPIKLMEYLIKLVTINGGTILDPFAGSGTTILAAKKLGIDAIGIEMNEEYCEIARRRIA